MDVLNVASSLTVAPTAALHISVGGAVASVGINMIMMISFSLLTWWTLGEDEQVSDSPEHAPKTVENFPLPDFLRDAGYERTINVGVFGMTGCGKSSLINALRRKQPGDSDAAPVGIKETTFEPVHYGLIDDQKHDYAVTGEPREPSRAVRIWDLPGVGTSTFSSEHCVREMGLRYFDVVVLLISENVSETDLIVSEELGHFKVPHLIVRSQVDCDIDNEVEDHGITSGEAEARVRKDMSDQGFKSVFLVSSRYPEKYDFHSLVSNIVASVQANRRNRKADGCPICFEKFDDEHKPCRCQWCRNSVCSCCSAQLQGKLDETPCPFCRRWTNLSPEK